MREFCDVSVVANLVSMLRADLDGAIWIVNDDDEGPFYEGCAHQNGRVVPTNGAAVAVLDELSRRGVEGVVAVVRGNEVRDVDGPIFRPQAGDVASILLCSQSVDRVLGDIGGMAWLVACGREIGSLLGRSLWIARLFRTLRLLRPSLVVSPIDNPDTWIDWTTFEINWRYAQATLVDLDLSNEAVAALVSFPVGEDVRADAILCDGEDAVRVLAAATRLYRPRGVSARKGVESVDLNALLRAGFDWEEFEVDRMYRSLVLWQFKHSRFPLLRRWRTLDPLRVVLDHRYIDADLEFLAHSVEMIGSVSAFQLDLDHFKLVNDTLGHSDGDDAIRVYATTVRNVLGSRGEVYRRGGDELVAYVIGMSDTEAALLAERLRTAIQDTMNTWAVEKALDTPPTASIGLLMILRSTTVQEMSLKLDAVQRLAKENGRNRVELAYLN